MRRLVCAALASAVFGSSALAISVEPEAGKSYLNRGSGYTALRGAASGKPGNLVMASAGGSAVITYDDGCKEKVNPEEVVVIKQESPCKAAPIDFIVGAAIIGGAGAIILLDDDGPASP